MLKRYYTKRAGTDGKKPEDIVTVYLAHDVDQVIHNLKLKWCAVVNTGDEMRNSLEDIISPKEDPLSIFIKDQYNFKVPRR